MSVGNVNIINLQRDKLSLNLVYTIKSHILKTNSQPIPRPNKL